MRGGWCSWQTLVVSIWFWIHWSCPFCVDLAQARQAILRCPFRREALCDQQCFLQ